MIKQLTYIFFLTFCLSLFSSCTIFSSDEDSEDISSEEDYYADDEALAEGEGEEGEAGEAEEGRDAEVADAEEVDEDINPSAEDESYQSMGSSEEVEYIDEEDEEYLVEQGEDIIVESDSSEGIIEESVEAEVLAEEESGSGEADQTGGFFSGGMGGEAEELTSTRKNIPYKKIKSAPYQAGGFLVNAVYIARPGENIQSISNKIFGSDQVSQLYAINPHLQSREVKVGDKIYYSSPNRPEDSNQLLFYFEDRGIQASYYDIPAGENIRKIAKQLLGHSSSWKEIWATNADLQSKGLLDSNLTVRYWPGEGEIVSPSSPSPPPAPADGQNSAETAPDFPEEEESLDEFPPSEAQASSDSPEPSPNAGEAPPPPPPPSAGGMENSPLAGGGGEEGDQGKFLNIFSQTNTTVGVALVIITLICAFAIIKKRRKKKEYDYTAANFELDE